MFDQALWILEKTIKLMSFISLITNSGEKLTAPSYRGE